MPEDASRVVVLRLGRGAAIRGRARYPDGGPVANATVAAAYGGGFLGPSMGLQRRETRTAADGSYVLEGLLDGGHAVRARLGGVTASVELELRPDVATSWDPVLDPGAAIGVRLVDEADKPLAGWKVEADPESAHTEDDGTSAVTDDAGRCNLGPLPRVPHRLRAFPGVMAGAEGSHAFLASATRRNVTPTGAEVELRLTALEVPSAKLCGQIFDGVGKPLPNVMLVVTRLDQGRGSVVHSHREDGRFEIGPLAAATYLLGAAIPGQEDASTRLAEVELSPGETRDLGRLRLPASSRVEVVVRTEAPLQAPRVEIGKPGVPGGALLELDRITAGTYRSRAISAGAYEVRLFAANAAPEIRAVEVRPGAVATVEIEARQAVTVELRFHFPADDVASGRRHFAKLSIDDASGTRVCQHLLGGEYDDQALRMKRFVLGLAAGEYEVAVRHGAARRTTTTTLRVPAEGGRVVADIRLQ
jgi:hypothetical protein